MNKNAFTLETVCIDGVMDIKTQSI